MGWTTCTWKSGSRRSSLRPIDAKPLVWISMQVSPRSTSTTKPCRGTSNRSPGADMCSFRAAWSDPSDCVPMLCSGVSGSLRATVSPSCHRSGARRRHLDWVRAAASRVHATAVAGAARASTCAGSRRTTRPTSGTRPRSCGSTRSPECSRTWASSPRWCATSPTSTTSSSARPRSGGRAGPALATQQTFQFEDDMRKLRVQRPSFEPASRDYVTDVVFLARALLDRGAAYERDGSVYFRAGDLWARSGPLRGRRAGGYGERGGRTDDPAKDDPFDAAIWQRSAEGEPSWDSPWGRGRPGWHAECAAMATSILGLADRRARRRRRPRLPAPRLRGGDRPGGHGRHARSPGRGCMWAPSPTTARRWPSPPATSCS